MAEVKRWSVTYTNHMKQKRKVYQDGFLQLNASSNKMLLYDDCEKLLECRMLKKDEEVSSGETLTFNSFLVDVNDAVSADGDRNPIPGFNPQAKSVKFNEKRAKPFVNPSSVNLNKPQPSMSPSQKIIREFKNRELHKYGAAQCSPEPPTTSKTEWQALYTTQLTQKAKKYHDGFLQLAISGSHAKQIILLDASRKQLDSRFLKKDEVIASGESIGFDGHLVEIGDREGDHKPITDLHFKETKCNVVGEVRIKQERTDGVIPSEDPKEWWRVLYTTQVTQKAKKYHDGFLQLKNCGSHRMQAMLFDTTRKLIDSKFLKTDEVIRSGESFKFDAHLVEIGEPEGDNQASVDLKLRGNDCKVQKSGKLDGEDDCAIVDNFEVKDWHALYTTQITQKAKKYHGGILRLAFSGSYRKKVSLLDEDKTMLGSKYVSLSDDIQTGCMIQLPKYLVEVGTPYESSGGEEKSHDKGSFTKASDSHISISGLEETKSRSGVPAKKPLRDAHQILSILQKPMAQESKVSGQADSSTARPVASSKESEVSDVMLVDSSEDDQPSQQPTSFETIEPSEKMATGKPPDLIMPFKVSSDTSSPVAGGIDIRKSDQLYSGHATQHDRLYTSGKSNLNSYASHDAAEKKSSSKEPTSEQTEEFPSFDLGF